MQCGFLQNKYIPPYSFNYILLGVSLHRADSIKDVGIIFDFKLKFTMEENGKKHTMQTIFIHQHCLIVFGGVKMR